MDIPYARGARLVMFASVTNEAFVESSVCGDRAHGCAKAARSHSHNKIKDWRTGPLKSCRDCGNGTVPHRVRTESQKEVVRGGYPRCGRVPDVLQRGGLVATHDGHASRTAVSCASVALSGVIACNSLSRLMSNVWTTEQRRRAFTPRKRRSDKLCWNDHPPRAHQFGSLNEERDQMGRLVLQIGSAVVGGEA